VGRLRPILLMRLGMNLIKKLLLRKTTLSTPSEYKCQYCDITKPLNDENFQSVRKFKYGYSTVCNECNKPKSKE